MILAFSNLEVADICQHFEANAADSIVIHDPSSVIRGCRPFIKSLYKRKRLIYFGGNDLGH